MLKGKQKKLDANKDGEISKDDFKLLRSKKEMKKGGKVKGYSGGGSVGSASKRADGIAQRGHTRGRMV